MHLPVVVRNGKEMVRYDPVLALEVVEKIADGELLSNITKKPFQISKHTFMQWVTSVPELQKAYLTAKRMSAFSFEEKAIDVAESLQKTPAKDKIAAANTLISQYRWTATRRDPTNYSDKGNTQIVVPVTINTPLDLGTGIRKSDVEDSSIYSINIPEAVEDAEFSEIDDGDSDDLPTDQRHDYFAATLNSDEPVEGTERQPLLEAAKRKAGGPKGPRKRILSPRIKP